MYKGAASEGQRAVQIQKRRQKEQQEIEHKKKKIEEDLKFGSIKNKFASHYDAIEQQLKSDTIGLVTLDDMKQKQEDMVRKRELQLAKGDTAARLVEERKEQKKREQKEKISKLSFAFDDEEEEDDDESETEATATSQTDEPDVQTDKQRKGRLGMDPTVNTSFLPDRDREEEDKKLREQLREEWLAKQDALKAEPVEITYSYWDGSGHRKQAKMRKGNTIQQFLQRVLDNIRKEFPDLKAVTVDQLMYVKEDLIIPQHYSFYDFIVTKARGKSGPLFNFDAYDDIRITNDSRVAKDESHAGKVCLRSWYERNKHIFPASRWEPYDPEKKWDNYTISDKNAAKITVK